MKGIAHKIFINILLQCVFLPHLGAQIATIENFGYTNQEQYPGFDEIEFNLNGVSFLGKDAATYHIPLKKSLDQCYAVFKSDTLFFQAKFRLGESYQLSAGCCCAAFNLQPENDGSRGNVIFKNNTRQAFGLVAGEGNAEIVPKREACELHAFESAMCLFKPCHILLTDSAYFSESFQYDSKRPDFDSLMLAHEQLILAKGNFLFLHGERIKAYFEKNSTHLRFRIVGYLKDAQE